MEKSQMQKLELEIRHISILKGIGADRISFSVPNDEVIDKVLGETEARKIFPELSFDLQISKDKGEDLLAALELKSDEIINVPRIPYNFRRLHSDGTT